MSKILDKVRDFFDPRDGSRGRAVVRLAALLGLHFGLSIDETELVTVMALLEVILYNGVQRVPTNPQPEV